MPTLLDHQFNELAVETHQNLVARAATGAGAGAVALFLLPVRVCLAWTIAIVAIEIWGWFASRRQYLRREVRKATQLNYLANLTSLIGAWFVLALLYWQTGTFAGGICAIVVLLSVVGFAQTFASRSPVGFTVCGVLPTVGMLAVVVSAPHDRLAHLWPVLGTLTLGIGFAIAGARQTFAAGRKLDEAQRRLSEREAQYRVLADNVTDVIGRSGLAGEWRYISPSIETALGYAPEAFLARRPLTHIHPDDRRRVAAVFADLVATGGDCTLEYRIFRKDGSACWMESSCALIHDPATGQPREVISTSRNIDHRKAMEADLIQARENAEAGAAAKSDFLANMTHELRTPLNAIVGFSGVLMDSATLGERDARHAKLINAASSTLLVVVNSVLDFSKLESGGFEFDPQPFDPAEMAASVAAMVEVQAKSRDLYLKVATSGEIGGVNGDAPRLQQVLLNLLGNALKFTRQGGVEVLVEQTNALDGMRRLKMSVIDTGVGIPGDKLSAIFERFTQADASVSRHFGGTGLGLAISKRIVELMGGRIGVTSTEGHGSTFWFELDLPAADLASAAVADDDASTDLERPLRLLLVEDNAVNRELVQVFLEPYDIEIEMAADGVAAVEAVGRARYDLVLMDVQMPVMDGMTAARLIRAMPDPAAQRLPIIAMTANVLPEQIRLCMDAGMDAHIGKPISPGRLLELLSQWTAPDDEIEAMRRSA